MAAISQHRTCALPPLLRLKLPGVRLGKGFQLRGNSILRRHLITAQLHTPDFAKNRFSGRLLHPRTAALRDKQLMQRLRRIRCVSGHNGLEQDIATQMHVPSPRVEVLQVLTPAALRLRQKTRACAQAAAASRLN